MLPSLVNSLGMSRKRTEIISPDAEEVERLLHATTDARDKERLIVARMAMSGQHTLAMMAQVSGRSRSTIQIWLERFRTGGVEGLLERTPSPGSMPSLGFEVQAQMAEKLAQGAWRSAREFRMWLEEAHHIKLSLAGCYYWLGKSERSSTNRWTAAIPGGRIRPKSMC
ncbi:MAG: transposase [Verrucomicrobiales bacterium]|nr:transposase [Verrucomicrobiales bacterium]